MRTIVTAANPLEPYYKNKSSVKVFTVFGTYNNSVSQGIDKIIGNQASRNSVWIEVGYDQNHTTVHDILLITLQKAIVPTHQRGPIYATLPFVDSIFTRPIPNTGWRVAGFAHLDKKHIKTNTDLEITDLPGYLVDCDEWMPREWGLFICVTDDEDLQHIPAGGPLINEFEPGIIFGIASFSLKKGNDSILVFTNMKSYRFGLTGYVANDTESSDNATETRREYGAEIDFYKILP